MNVSKITFLTCILFFWLTGCSESNTPEAIAQSFSKALYSADFNKAKSLCTLETQEGIGFIAELCKDKVNEMKKSGVKAEVSNCKMDESGEKATVYLNVTNAFNLKTGEVDTQIQEQKVKLIKQDGKWQVVFKVK